MALTVAICHSRAGLALIAAIALFLPWIPVVVVAERLPESGTVLVHESQAAHPLGALPEVEMRHDDSRGAAVLGRERLAVVVERHEGLPIHDVGDGDVRGVAAVRESRDEPRLGIELDVLEKDVEADATPFRVELRPRRYARDVDDEVLRRELLELVPAPLHRLFDQSLDAKGPLLEVRLRRRPGGQHRKVGDEVLSRRDAVFPGARRRGTPNKASSDEPLPHEAKA